MTKFFLVAPLKSPSTGYKFPGGPVMYRNDDGGGGQYWVGGFFGEGGDGGGDAGGGGGDGGGGDGDGGGYWVHGEHFSPPGAGTSSSFLESKPLIGVEAIAIRTTNRFTTIGTLKPCILNPKLDLILITKMLNFFFGFDLVEKEKRKKQKVQVLRKKCKDSAVSLR